MRYALFWDITQRV